MKKRTDNLPKMQVVRNYPPNFTEISKTFNIRGRAVVFTYGQTIYNPHGGAIADHLEVHESVHGRQQGDDPKAWWYRYLREPKFRIEQEVEAYAYQYAFVRDQEWGDETLQVFLEAISSDLSSPIYGKVVTFQEAEQMIKKESHNIKF